MNTARELMSRHVFTVRADWTVPELAEFLINKNILGAPVVDEAHRLVGVVSETDIARSEGEDRAERLDGGPHELYVHGWEGSLASTDLSSFGIQEVGERFVRDIMSTSIFSVDEFASVAEIADMMTESKVHRVLVTSNGRVVGIITALDLVALIHRSFQSSVLPQSA